MQDKEQQQAPSPERREQTSIQLELLNLGSDIRREVERGSREKETSGILAIDR